MHSGRQHVHVVVFDGFADWEPSYVLAELRRSGGRSVRVVGFTTDPVVSMGGLRVTPDIELGAVRSGDVELLVLPGGDLWETTAYPRAALESLIHALLELDTPVAAICGATLALGRAGVLNDRRHTSNGREYLPAHATGYAGATLYVDSPAVRDRRVITASGLAAVDFARAVFAELRIFSAADETLWFDMFRNARLPTADGSSRT